MNAGRPEFGRSEESRACAPNAPSVVLVRLPQQRPGSYQEEPPSA